MIIKLLITYQILVINLILTHLLAKNKYSNLVIFTSLFLFTVIQSVALYFLSPLFSGEKPTAWFVIVGLFYLIPLYLLYDISIKKLFTIMVYCWTYTMIIGSIAVGLSSYINLFGETLEILIIQTFLIITTIKFIVSFTKNKFMVVISDASDKTKNLLLLLGISLFTTITSIRYVIHPDEFIYILLVFLLLIIITTSYRLIFNNVQSNINLDCANMIVYNDSLTGIRNRHSLFVDINQLILDKKVFTLLFLDLDDLKNINDTFGHNTGDEYIKHFAKTLASQTLNCGRSYRFAGDEFVCILAKEAKDFDIELFENNIKKEMNIYYEFNGVSVGVSEHPKNGSDPDKLLHFADSRMYGIKNRKKIRNSHLRNK